MESEVKVFQSEISRVDFTNESSLYELLKITPAQPVLQQTNDNKNETWEFLNHEKHYVPRKGSKLKVKTVLDIRALFENDVYSYISDELDKQRQYLLRKIRDGSSYEKNTLETAIKLLESDTPISRAAWQMLANINPEKHNHSKQFVLWNGKTIQINGSRGGKTKFICNYDLKLKKIKNKCTFKKTNSKSRLGLLRNSLNVKFRPGPLGKKQFLDSSHHKYQMGDIELVMLPTPVLEISTAYGTVLEPTISNFINYLRGDKGIISQKLAEFSVSALGTIKDNIPVQLERKCIPFDLNYKCGQNRLLTRRSVADTTFHTNIKSCFNATDNCKSKSITMQTDVENFCNSNKHVYDVDESVSEIKKMMNEILDSIEISVKQDSMFITEDESRENNVLDDSRDLTAKDKPKRRYCELDKLDVTIIKLPQSSQKDYTKPCGKSFCTLGCICESIDCPFSLKQHCGVLDCMFGCKCEVSKYKNIELLVERDCSDIIPGLLNLDNEINSHLAKEEQKFHQTVIVSGEKSILLKSRKRNLKSSKKYAEFYSQLNLKGDENIKKIVTVDVTKLNCENIEPFCMVHNLYKCFCKGKFIESYIINKNASEISINKDLTIEHTKVNNEVIADENCLNTSTKPRLRRSCETVKNISITETSEFVQSTSARTMGYSGRKYTDEYYKNTNNKIMEMEKNDSVLKKKISRLVNPLNDDLLQTLDTPKANIEYNKNDEFTSKTCNKSSESNNKALNKTVENTSVKNFSPFVTTKGKNSLKQWLETSYKSYKERTGQGLLKNSLGPPKNGKAVLQSWDFILSRYRERKNVFFVSKQVPFRTFLARDKDHPFFNDCINIDDIRFADLPKYPLIIRNLVTNATDSENSFCILRGWDHYWELIGSAVKVIERTAESHSESEEPSDTDKLMMQNERENENETCQKTKTTSESTSSSDSKEVGTTEQNDQLERSRWFVMTVENDFTEIQFYKRGFYVTYDGIQQTIALARCSGKTVRLSSGARTDKNSSLQFGVYAVACNNECCVFIGPYEIDEPLGIEVVKTFLDPRKMKKTRGVWIITNKIDNIKVLEHPLSFLPPRTSDDAIVHIDPSFNSASTEQLKTNPTDENYQVRTTTSIVLKKKSDQEISKVIKPIKIQRTNGFYHLSKTVLQKIPVNKKSLIKPIKINKSAIVNKKSLSLLAFDNSGESNAHPPQKPVAEVAPHVINTEKSRPTSPRAPIRPVAEIAPQIKIASVYSQAHLQNETVNFETSSSGMLILKPEEINKKILASTMTTEKPGSDVEKFLESSVICVAPKEVLVVSDGEDDETDPWRSVFIQCWNIEHFGWLRGRMNADKLLSFEFPGFKYSDFYKESEAFEKINQVLARKIYIPKNCTLLWQVIIDEEYLNSDMLTPACLEDKKYLLIRLREHRQRKVKKSMSTMYSKRNDPVAGVTKTTIGSFNKKCAELSQRRTELEDLEQASRELEQQSEVLWKRAITKRKEIMGSLSVPDNLKVGMTETLQDIMSMNTP